MASMDPILVIHVLQRRTLRLSGAATRRGGPIRSNLASRTIPIWDSWRLQTYEEKIRREDSNSLVD